MRVHRRQALGNRENERAAQPDWPLSREPAPENMALTSQKCAHIRGTNCFFSGTKPSRPGPTASLFLLTMTSDVHAAPLLHETLLGYHIQLRFQYQQKNK